MIDINKLDDIYKNFNSSFYINDLEVVKKRILQVKNSFPEFSLLYSVKANPHNRVLKQMNKCSIGIDAGSAIEVISSINAGISSKNIFYSSPGKTINDISLTYDKCTIIADSISELALLESYASNHKKILSIGVRLNIPNEIIQHSQHEIMGGQASQFGIPIEEFISIDKNKYKNLSIIGIHVYFGSQILDENVVVNNFSLIANTARNVSGNFNLRFVNFGGGFGIPYEKDETELNLDYISKKIFQISDIKWLMENSVKCNLELGRYLVADSALYVTKVVDVKHSYGKVFVIIDGGMNAFFRPIMTGDYHDVFLIPKRSEVRTVSIVGNTCTPLDIYYDQIEIPLPSNGDLIGFKNAGAYGFSMSLLEFLSHKKPKQIFIGGTSSDGLN